jgi:DNA repair protein RadC
MISEEKALSGSVKSSSDVSDFLMPLMRDLKKEYFKLLLLNKQNAVTDVIDIDQGTVDKANPYIRDILQLAIQYHAPAMIVAHNHPSSSVEPSEHDKILTRDLIIASSAMEIRVFDHIIIGDNQYYSFADEGLIEEFEMLSISSL